ncbi:15112_t:CDS:2 [Racocetra persica]|uniref:15112_t:CDS:1 n=1 Tax=Racocetra persica TaxID=160502 RepID=A0ACA9L635_9GLOM|nr:15112_t:CDS:2 [Racocetra persica]
MELLGIEERHSVISENIGLRFKDVGGLHEAKEELQEVVAFFPKALAGECGLPFLFRSGSEFEEMLVGVGARRVRELFQEARHYPQGCIVFIDEIDSIGKKRGTPNSNDLTLNQLLNELDGFQPRENIFLIAATNFPQTLDSALLRPGRFDRQIYIPLPNLQARREIIKLAAPKIPFRSDVDLEELAALTRGLSGAQIVNLFNEAALLSLRLGQPKISADLIFEAYDRVLMGPSSTSNVISPRKRRITAFHEAGHALVGLSLPETSVKKITIVPRWLAAQVAAALGGRASEELIFGTGHITAGAAQDFKNASQLIKDFIYHYGMSTLGIVPAPEPFLAGEEIFEQLPEKSKEKIANEREEILR